MKHLTLHRIASSLHRFIASCSCCPALLLPMKGGISWPRAGSYVAHSQAPNRFLSIYYHSRAVGKRRKGPQKNSMTAGAWGLQVEAHNLYILLSFLPLLLEWTFGFLMKITVLFGGRLSVFSSQNNYFMYSTLSLLVPWLLSKCRYVSSSRT